MLLVCFFFADFLYNSSMANRNSAEVLYSNFMAEEAVSVSIFSPLHAFFFLCIPLHVKGAGVVTAKNGFHLQEEQLLFNNLGLMIRVITHYFGTYTF